MPTTGRGRQNLFRLALLTVTTVSVAYVAGLPAEKASLNYALGALVVVFIASVLAAMRPFKAPLHVTLLGLDLLAVGAVGCILAEDSAVTVDGRLLFVSGYLVSVLVAFVGARLGAALLGSLAGVMVLAMGTVFTLAETAQPDPALMVVQVVLIFAFALHTAVATAVVRRDAQASEFARHVEREIQSREAASAELVSFTQALADSSTIAELAEAALQHLRCHSGLDARAVVLESEGEEIALWEESGQLDKDQREHRRLRLQESLAGVGSSHIVRELRCNATTIRAAQTATPNFRTAVDIPVRVGGRIAGVLLIADPAAGALPPDRIGVLVDVARRTSEAVRRLERQRGHEQRRTALLLRQMREGVLLLGAEGQVQLANPAARRVLAACSAEDGDPSAPQRVGDLTLQELSHTPPGVSRRFRATVSEGRHAQPLQLACTAISVLDRGQRIGTLVTLADVTEEELARGRIVQTERTTLVGQTLAGVAHELNNPLAALIGYADLLDGMQIPEEILKPVSSMKEQALRATRIVRNLLNFARRRNPERVPTSIAELTQGTVELFAYEARMADVEVHVAVPEDLPPVLADKHALQQVLVNLVQNALHALQEWNGERALTIQGSASREGVTLCVSDTGPGVPAELRKQVFDSFFTTKGPNTGTGLGLALSRSIAHDHGGELLLAPDTGTGASFYLRLPVREARTGVVLDQSPAEELHSVPESVLVVDDDASVRETLVAQLGQMGARVDSAANIIEAERMMGTKSYGAVLLDLRMPGGTGLDLHDTLLESNPFQADRIIFITGDFVNDDLTNKARQTGQQLLEKPFTIKELTGALGSLAA